MRDEEAVDHVELGSASRPSMPHDPPVLDHELRLGSFGPFIATSPSSAAGETSSSVAAPSARASANAARIPHATARAALARTRPPPHGRMPPSAAPPSSSSRRGPLLELVRRRTTGPKRGVDLEQRSSGTPTSSAARVEVLRELPRAPLRGPPPPGAAASPPSLGGRPRRAFPSRAASSVTSSSGETRRRRDQIGSPRAEWIVDGTGRTSTVSNFIVVAP